MKSIPNIEFYSKHTKYKDLICIGLVVNVGSELDFNTKGLAHFLEHMLIEPYRNNLGNDILLIRGTTNINATSYEIFIKNTNTNRKLALKIISEIINGASINRKYFEIVKNDIINEIAKEKGCVQEKLSNLLFSSSSLGNTHDVKKINYEDVVSFYCRHYRTAKYSLYYLGPDIDKFNSYANIHFYKTISFKNNNNLTCTFGSTAICNNNSFYIKVNSLPQSLYCRVIEDVVLLIVENSQSLTKDFNIKIDKIYFNKQNRYVHISLNKNKDGIKIPFSIYFTKLLNEAKSIFKDILPLYIELINKNDYIDIFEWSEEVKNYLIFDVPIYIKEDYLKLLYNLDYTDIHCTMNDFFLKLSNGVYKNGTMY